MDSKVLRLRAGSGFCREVIQTLPFPSDCFDHFDIGAHEIMVLQKPDLILIIGILTMAIFFRTILMVGILIKIILRRTIFTVATMIIRILKTILTKWTMWTMLIA